MLWFKLLIILLAFVFLPSQGFTDNYQIQNPNDYCSKIALPTDVASKDRYAFCLADKTAFKDHGFQIVDKSDGYPVRAGNHSMRFELRDGDCNDPVQGWNDCQNDRERFEALTSFNANDIYLLGGKFNDLYNLDLDKIKALTHSNM